MAFEVAHTSQADQMKIRCYSVQKSWKCGVLSIQPKSTKKFRKAWKNGNEINGECFKKIRSCCISEKRAVQPKIPRRK